MLLIAAKSVSATPSDFLVKCRNTNAQAEPLAFVPVPEAVDGSEYTPRVLLQPGSDAWNLLARWEFSEVEQPSPRKPLVYILDGEIVEPDVYQQFTKDIEFITFSCSDGVHEALGIEPGHTLVVAFSFPVRELLAAEVKKIESMQADFMAASGRFARSLEELGWKAAEVPWVMELTVSQDGSSWNATGRHVLLDEREARTATGSR
jgi:hypothetical protein